MNNTPNQLTPLACCARDIHARFGCTQDGIGLEPFIERATPIIEEHFKVHHYEQCKRLAEAAILLDEAFGWVTNPPMADAISVWLHNNGMPQAAPARAQPGETRTCINDHANRLARCLADLAGYIASVRTDRLVEIEGELFVAQTKEWAIGANELAKEANLLLELHDAIVPP